MAAFNHFLITRFNVRSQTGFDYKIPEQPEVITDEGYLEYRFFLFDKYCYPTVSAQTSSDFTWLVFFDSAIPRSFKNRIEKYSEWRIFVPVFVSEFNEYSVKCAINERITGNPRYIITTRLDNDDGICRDYIKMIQDNFREKDGELINFNWGYYITHPGGKVYLRGRAVNPFASLIEDREDFLTVYFRVPLSHSSWKDVYKSKGLFRNIILDGRRPAWLVVFHGKNLCNKRDIYNGFRQPRNRLQEYFNAKADWDKEDNPVLILFDQILFYVRHNKSVISIKNAIGQIRIRLGKFLRTVFKTVRP
jgi:hypothetical protein